MGAVVLDEFHERHLATATSRWRCSAASGRAPPRPSPRGHVGDARRRRPSARFLGEAPVLRSEGRRFEVEIEHLPAADDRPARGAGRVAGLQRLVARRTRRRRAGLPPGRARRSAAPRRPAPTTPPAHGLRVLPLHGDLPAAEQDRRRPARGSARRSSSPPTSPRPRSPSTASPRSSTAGSPAWRPHSPWSGLPSLRVRPDQPRLAAQRAGRAGRTRPGRLPPPLHAGGSRERAPSTTRRRSLAPISPRPCSSWPPPASPNRGPSAGSSRRRRPRSARRRSSCRSSARARRTAASPLSAGGCSPFRCIPGWGESWSRASDAASPSRRRGPRPCSPSARDVRQRSAVRGAPAPP